MTIIIESKRKNLENLKKRYPGALIADVTSSSNNEEYRKFSPFYPHYHIPVPFSDGMTAACVEAIWQGLKVFESTDVDVEMFKNDTMRNIKRTVRRFGRPLGHRKGVNGNELLDYISARHQIYVPTYKWMLENCCRDLVESLRRKSEKGTVVLLDYNTNGDVDDPSKPLSHAALIKAYVLGLPPFGDNREVEQKPANEQLSFGF